ncbi:MAG TPA: hypothetical protein VH325_01245 [Bryobacteraceae bacterium]|jgi:hypothetical protein|nr:hypothetical protein [Bryobacteraceae bacterium]
METIRIWVYLVMARDRGKDLSAVGRRLAWKTRKGVNGRPSRKDAV